MQHPTLQHVAPDFVASFAPRLSVLGKGNVLTKTIEKSSEIKFATQGCWPRFVQGLTKRPKLKRIFSVLTH